MYKNCVLTKCCIGQSIIILIKFCEKKNKHFTLVCHNTLSCAIPKNQPTCSMQISILFIYIELFFDVANIAMQTREYYWRINPFMISLQIVHY